MAIEKTEQNGSIIYKIDEESKNKLVTTVERVKKENETIYNIKGRIDTQTSSELQEIIEADIKGDNVNLILNFNDVKYLSSAGLRIILYFQKKINKLKDSNMKIVDVRPEIMEIFEMTDFTEFLTIEATK